MLEHRYWEGPNLHIRFWNWDVETSLVSRSASWFWDFTCTSFSRPAATLSRIKWQSISTCLKCSWNVGLVDRWIAAWLSQKTMVELTSTSKCFNRPTSQETSLAIAVKVRYSASADDRETVSCFFDFQEIKESLRKTQ